MTSKRGGVGLFEWVSRADSTNFVVMPTDYSRSPWVGETLHGGPVVGMVAFAARHAVGQSDMICVRATTDILAPVLVAKMTVSSTVFKRGRRTTVIDVSIVQNNRIVVRATTQWAVTSRGAASHTQPKRHAPPFRSLQPDFEVSTIDYPRPGFNRDAVETRLVHGSSEEPGPAMIWARLDVDLIAGEEVHPFDKVAALSDLAAAAGWDYGPGGSVFINPDITLQLNQMPVGDWVGFDATNRLGPSNVGFNDAVVYDRSGPIGHVLQSLVESPATLGTQTAK